MNDNTSRISSVLAQVRLLKHKYEELAAVTGEDFNVFSILGVEADEVRTHSAFLVDLLNHQGSHRQGTAFLKLFLVKFCKYPGFDTDKNLESFRVGKEVRTDQGQIDILLVKEKAACIVIENKIYAEDQVSQLNRYYQYAKTIFSDDNQIKLIYLTLDGSPPDKTSLKAVKGQGRDLREDEVIRISYGKHIINWLEECMKLKEVQRVSPIREIVFQYRDLLKELTGQSTNTRYSMELKDILVEQKNYELIPYLEEAILAFKVHVQFKFWEELKKQILKLPEVEKWHKTQDKDPTEDNIRHFYNLKSKKRYVTQTFCLKSVNWNSYDIALETGANYGQEIFFGFILFKNGKRVGYCLNEEFNNLVRILGNGFNRHNWWIARKSSKLNLRFPIEYSDKIAEVLLDDGERGKLVQQFVGEIAAAVTQLKENLNQS